MIINHLKRIELTRALQGKSIDRAELAKKLGVKIVTVGAYFTGQITPPLDKAYKICHYLNMPIQNVFEYVHEDENDNDPGNSISQIKR